MRLQRRESILHRGAMILKRRGEMLVRKHRTSRIIIMAPMVLIACSLRREAKN